ncbi:Molybdopterin oxidoreductase Fe4S4 domain protein [Acididesulfobacillus acetoxydans]|uniref:Molybdopterin oxidoreductase Fe4S4 domain protein n=1 Tax=Acididesulfobacillus acetoxydans TaxID=1561005 RepID=A0A8S0Y1P8_9FIRM|nr:molybdopterin-dependent oxidoreductase [Acididesulfobacillus acetoxydans]CAA7599775.1 Molybdopterin oxidoreductase Fe4S4 domain protein [Acididesulfobacillus acetoxydans]CEJ07341.1 Trimethylamine-N-oxide reductase [Acididesulfobacillus acetoxydans]
MTEVVRSACPLNCPDSCAFLVEKTQQGLRVYGDRENPITRGFICAKGRALAERVFSRDRLRFPQLRAGTSWKRISWEEAYKLLAGEIRRTVEETGPWGIFHHFDYGHNGVLRALDRRFFQALGGVTEPRGSMCWGAGYRAQEIDFGAVRSSLWQDLVRAGLIILWGRDPAVTSIHLQPLLRAARRQGAKLIVINPVRVRSADFADAYFRVNPGTDGALALGLAHIVLDRGWLDQDFVKAHVKGFSAFAVRVKDFPPAKVSALTGMSVEDMRFLAESMGREKPVSFLLGYGLQRYTNGGNTVRAVDALAALTGNVGRPGAGVHFAHAYHKRNLNSLFLPPGDWQSRAFPHALLAQSLKQADPPVRLALVTRSNPLVQQPDSLLWREVWQGIRFKVVLDTVMTETAKQSDLVLPVTTVFEEEDLIATSWSPFLQYAGKVLEPQGEAKAEPLLFTELAQRLGLGRYFPFSAAKWLEYVLEPLAQQGVTLGRLKEGPLRAPYIPEVAWGDYLFATPSGKIELFSELARKESGDPMANFTGERPDVPGGDGSGLEGETREFPFYLLTPHPAAGIHSQFMEGKGLRVFIHPSLAGRFKLSPGDMVLVSTARGQLQAPVAVSEAIHPSCVVIPEGVTAGGLGVNQLIGGRVSDLGESTSYYEERCTVRATIRA